MSGCHVRSDSDRKFMDVCRTKTKAETRVVRLWGRQKERKNEMIITFSFQVNGIQKLMYQRNSIPILVLPFSYRKLNSLSNYHRLSDETHTLTHGGQKGKTVWSLKR